MKDQKRLTRLVERARNGDADAFAQLYSMYSRNVFYIALKMMKSEHDAKDVAQEVMLRLYKGLGGVRNPETLGSFIDRTTYNCCLTALRKRQSVEFDDDAESALTVQPEENADFIPEEYAARKEQRDHIIRLVEELSPPLRSVVLLFYYKEQSVEQIADALDMNKETVKNRLFRARGILKKQLEGAWKEGVLRAMSVPVLTQVLQQNAQAEFSAQIDLQIWEGVCNKIGFTAATITATAATATAATAVGTGTGVAATATTAATTTATSIFAATGTKIVAATLITALTATSVLYGTGVIGGREDLTQAPAAGEPPALSEQAEEPVPPSGGETAIVSLPEEGEDIHPSQESVRWPAPAGTDRIPTRPDDSGGGSSSASSAAEATTSAEESPGGGSGSGGSSSAAQASIRNDTLTYPVDTALSAEMVIEDAGLELTGWNATPTVEVIGLGAVDTSEPNLYGVFIQVRKSGAETYHQFAVIIRITA